MIIAEVIILHIQTPETLVIIIKFGQGIVCKAVKNCR